MVITDKKIEEIDSYLIKKLSPERYRHSLSTAETAENICSKFGMDKEKGFFTGLIHDIAREYDDKEIINICSKGGENINEQELKDPVLLHGKAGAVLLKEKFNITDEEILNAVRVHTTGSKGMSSIAKVLFIADYIEPGRKHITDEYLKSLENCSLNCMVKSVLSSIIEYLDSIGRNADYSSLDLLKELDL